MESCDKARLDGRRIKGISHRVITRSTKHFPLTSQIFLSFKHVNLHNEILANGYFLADMGYYWFTLNHQRSAFRKKNSKILNNLEIKKN